MFVRPSGPAAVAAVAGVGARNTPRRGSGSPGPRLFQLGPEIVQIVGHHSHLHERPAAVRPADAGAVSLRLVSHGTVAVAVRPGSHGSVAVPVAVPVAAAVAAASRPGRPSRRRMRRTPVGDRASQIPQSESARIATAVDEGLEPIDLVIGSSSIDRSEAEQLGRPLVEAMVGQVISLVGGQHCMEIGPAKAEGAYTCSAVRVGPRLCRGVERKRALSRVVGRVGGDDVDRGRPHAALEGESDLDQAGHACGALGMADLRLDRAEGDTAHLGAGFPEHLVEYGQLGPIPHHRPRPVGFDQAHIGGGHARLAVGALEGAALPFGTRCREPQASPVARSRYPVDHCVDPVAVALRVLEPLQHRTRNAFAQSNAISIGVEASALPGRRQGVDPREQEVVVHPVMEVGPSTQNHVAGAGPELLARHVHCGQRRSTRRVHRVVHAAKIEPVGDPAGDDIGEHPRKRVLGQ